MIPTSMVNSHLESICMIGAPANTYVIHHNMCMHSFFFYFYDRQPGHWTLDTGHNATLGQSVILVTDAKVTSTMLPQITDITLVGPAGEDQLTTTHNERKGSHNYFFLFYIVLLQK